MSHFCLAMSLCVVLLSKSCLNQNYQLPVNQLRACAFEITSHRLDLIKKVTVHFFIRGPWWLSG